MCWPASDRRKRGRPAENFDITPFFFSAAGIVVFLDIFRYRFLDLIPVARGIIFENRGDGIVVTDAGYRIINMNKRAEALLGIAGNTLGSDIRRTLPSLLCDSIISQHTCQTERSFSSGASGFLLKKLDGDSLYKNLQDLQNGKNPFSPGQGDLLLKKISHIEKEAKESVSLSGRQLRILEYLNDGLTYKEIGKKLFVSEQTVKYHIAKIKHFTGSKTRLQLLEFYRTYCRNL